ncbi:MAG TPA: hypothetical protein VGK72_03655 [Chthoniobacterales bacterium]
MDKKQRLTALDFLAHFLDLGKASREIDRVLSSGAPSAEKHRGATERAGIHFRDHASIRGSNRTNDRRGVHALDFFERAGVALLRFDERDKFFPCAPVL